MTESRFMRLLILLLLVCLNKSCKGKELIFNFDTIASEGTIAQTILFNYTYSNSYQMTDVISLESYAYNICDKYNIRASFCSLLLQHALDLKDKQDNNTKNVINKEDIITLINTSNDEYQTLFKGSLTVYKHIDKVLTTLTVHEHTPIYTLFLTYTHLTYTLNNEIKTFITSLLILPTIDTSLIYSLDMFLVINHGVDCYTLFIEYLDDLIISYNRTNNLTATNLITILESKLVWVHLPIYTLPVPAPTPTHDDDNNSSNSNDTAAPFPTSHSLLTYFNYRLLTYYSSTLQHLRHAQLAAYSSTNTNKSNNNNNNTIDVPNNKYKYNICYDDEICDDYILYIDLSLQTQLTPTIIYTTTYDNHTRTVATLEKGRNSDLSESDGDDSNICDKIHEGQDYFYPQTLINSYTQIISLLQSTVFDIVDTKYISTPIRRVYGDSFWSTSSFLASYFRGRGSGSGGTNSKSSGSISSRRSGNSGDMRSGGEGGGSVYDSEYSMFVEDMCSVPYTSGTDDVGGEGGGVSVYLLYEQILRLYAVDDGYTAEYAKRCVNRGHNSDPHGLTQKLSCTGHQLAIR